MQCENCGVPVSGEELFEHGGKKYCEDCYIEAATVLKTCDPLAVRAARVTREKSGQRGAEGLLPVQKMIYDYLKKNGKATREQIARELQLEQKDLEKHFSVLRHCELVKGRKEGEIIYMILMDS